MALKKEEHQFSGKAVSYWLDASAAEIDAAAGANRMICITDENVFSAHPALFADRDTIVLPAGEAHKQQSTVDRLLHELIAREADRQTWLVGIGGGVITDITGYAASVYLRGVPFGFVPSTLLAMVDAAIGGKNGVDVGPYKNLVGVIRQPRFLLFNYSLLSTLPRAEWINGFAEVIKHASIRDAELFRELEAHDLEDFRSQPSLLADLVARNVAIKTKVVKADEFETGERKLLNFGHTFGHAIENTYQLPHGHAVSIGMLIACRLSERLTGFEPSDTERIRRLLEKYHLPVAGKFEKGEIWKLMKLDKKRTGASMSFILLNHIGDARVEPVSMGTLEDFITQSLVS